LARLARPAFSSRISRPRGRARQRERDARGRPPRRCSALAMQSRSRLPVSNARAAQNLRPSIERDDARPRRRMRTSVLDLAGLGTRSLHSCDQDAHCRDLAPRAAAWTSHKARESASCVRRPASRLVRRRVRRVPGRGTAAGTRRTLEVSSNPRNSCGYSRKSGLRQCRTRRPDPGTKGRRGSRRR